jgi:hypothetical protein
MQSWVNNPQALKKFLCGLSRTENKIEETVPVTSMKQWQTWRTIKLGTGLKTADDFRKAIKQAGAKIDDWGNDILGNTSFTTSNEEIEVELVVASVAELGFKDGAIRMDLYIRAKELGLDLCQPEVGPQLFLQYKDQPKGEWLTVAMEPIADSARRLRVFRIGHGDGGRRLRVDYGRPDRFYGADRRFVFLRRK